MASLKGLSAYAREHQLMGEALVVNVGGHERCMVAEMAPNFMAKAAGEGNVPQIRFICDGYCGLVPERSSKQCRAVDRAATPQNVPAPPGLVRVVQTRVSTPYRSGAGAGGTTSAGPLRVIPGGLP